MIHHRKRNRLQNYVYSIPGYYFVTICTKGMMEYFGCVRNGKMELNDAGRMVKKWSNQIPDKYSSVCHHTFCVMPNHVHAIIEIVGIDPRVCPDKNMVNT